MNPGTEACGTAEILVPRSFEWWTFLALVADPIGKFNWLSFVSKFSPDVRSAVVDAHLLQENIEALKGKSLVIVILWDGYQTYRETESSIKRLAQVATKVELRIVGESHDLDATFGFDSRPLFTQQQEAYEPEKCIAGLERVSFSRPFAKSLLRHRTKLISAKVFLQLIRTSRLDEYKRTSFVYCGHSGLTALARYSQEYGVDRDRIPDRIRDDFSTIDLASLWIRALHEKRGLWTNGIVVRALLRFLALNALATHRKDQLFLNTFPDPNINVYQAEMLFRSHVFLDFGGSHGDELIYPRSADLLFLNRKVLRFDFSASTSDLWRLNADDPTSLSRFAEEFQVSATTSLDERQSAFAPLHETAYI